MRGIIISVIGFLMCFLGTFHGYGHETVSSSLQLSKNDKSIHAVFKTPIENEEGSSIRVEFPKSWEERSTNSSINQVDKSIEYSYVFEIQNADKDEALLIIRGENHHSPLIVSVVSKYGVSTDILLADVRDWYPPFYANSTVNTFSSFTFLGIEHILIGFDHLLFVLALLFLVQGKKLIWAITSFTLAHSITLAISTFKIFEFPIGVVEALIAFSIVLLAVEMTKPADQRHQGNYVQMAFVFGLLHGFGFASVLSELGVPGNNIPVALLAFNVGVEIGQLTFVFTILGILYLFFKQIPRNSIAKIISYPIGGLAAFWFIERTLGII